MRYGKRREVIRYWALHASELLLEVEVKFSVGLCYQDIGVFARFPIEALSRRHRVIALRKKGV